jgi:hypothetical protein
MKKIKSHRAESDRPACAKQRVAHGLTGPASRSGPRAPANAGSALVRCPERRVALRRRCGAEVR